MHDFIVSVYTFFGIPISPELLATTFATLVFGPMAGALWFASHLDWKRKARTANSRLMARAYENAQWEEYYTGKVSELVRPAKEAFQKALKDYGSGDFAEVRWKLFRGHVLLRAAVEKESDFTRFMWVPMEVFDKPDTAPEVISEMVWEHEDTDLEGAQEQWEVLKKK